MRAIAIEPYAIDPHAVPTGAEAFRALAGAAASYLGHLDAIAETSSCPAMVTRIRGTGPGVSFGTLISAIEQQFTLDWTCPFEGSPNVAGAPLLANMILGEEQTDGFLFLRFVPGTRDLPLHIHPESDRFIFVIGGRGFFHIANKSLENCAPSNVRHVPARDRDAFMFRRGVVHTFSTAEHPLVLLSYHRPFIALDDDSQYAVGSTPLTPAEFLKGYRSSVSFDAAWTGLI